MDETGFRHAYNTVGSSDQQSIFLKLSDTQGNLDAAAKSLEAIGKEMYGEKYPNLNYDQWATIISQHDQGGPYGDKGYNGKDSNKMHLRTLFRDMFRYGRWEAQYWKDCRCEGDKRVRYPSLLYW